MGTKNNPGKYDCYAKAEPDEPVFVLLGRDRAAPALVWLWAVMREMEEHPNVEKIAEARQCVVDMIQYCASRGLPALGVGHSVMAGMVEMIRTINYLTKVAELKPQNAEMTLADFRAFFCQTRIEPETPPAADPHAPDLGDPGA